ncbi:MAG: DUF1343 domain-containing protein [Acidobacteria bacterium]|jgi:uncharacterized protein YbbC (DUF1343 family)|nr:MAG: DUF1343 domain-containing protein [Acidobacteriota bacterium]GIU81142.1 MAG: hypothetical protein KatS3mg006_0206 [Pyrinomonadaceae bacterium]
MKRKVKLGLERLLSEKKSLLKGKRIGLICNQASVNHKYNFAADLLLEDKDLKLKAIFGPQHGFNTDVQDNMIETPHSTYRGIAAFSLYSETRKPTAEMLKDIDTLLFDLQDVGCRVYTYIYTMANSMLACAENNKEFIVLDRPNPIGGIEIEGNLVESGYESFVGMFPIPMRHGMTVGELALMFNQEFNINCSLQVLEMQGWKRNYFYDETDAPWVMPSPNMPTVDTAVVFPGTVFFEGTQVSEGRGTTRPFEMIGAPYIDARKLAEEMNALQLPGVIFRPVNFIPTFQKHSGKSCGGVFLHVTNRREFKPVLTGIALLKTIHDLYPLDFRWKEPPYEYVFDKNPFDVIAGTNKLRVQIESGCSLQEIVQSWKEDEETFAKKRQRYLLYD